MNPRLTVLAVVFAVTSMAAATQPVTLARVDVERIEGGPAILKVVANGPLAFRVVQKGPPLKVKLYGVRRGQLATPLTMSAGRVTLQPNKKDLILTFRPALRVAIAEVRLSGSPNILDIVLDGPI
jgi:hypothetical protein